MCAACLQHTRAPLHPSDARVLFISRLPCAHLLFKFKRKEFLFFLFGTCITRHERRKPAQQNCGRGRRCSKPGAPSVVDSIRRFFWRHDFVVGVAGVLCGLCCSRATGCNSTRGRRHHRLLELHHDGVGVRLRTRGVLPTRCWCCYRQAHCCAPGCVSTCCRSRFCFKSCLFHRMLACAAQECSHGVCVSWTLRCRYS